MLEQNSLYEPESSSRDRRVYPLIVISAGTGVFFFIYYEFIDFTLSNQSILVVLAGLTFGVPLLMGYTGYSFWAGTITGILPWLGIQLGPWLELPLTPVTVRNLVNSFVIDASMSLPVVAILYIVGVGLRDRDALSDRARPLAIRFAVTVLFVIAVFLAGSMGYLTVRELH